MRDDEPQSRWKRVLKAPIHWMALILKWLGAASEGFERKFQKATKRASTFGDAATKADSVFGKFAQILASPMVRLWNSWLQPLGRRIRGSSAFRKIGSATYWLWYPLVALGSFGRTFIQTRSRGLLIWSIPFAVVIGGCLFALWVLNLDGDSVTQEYRRAIDEAIAKGEFQQATLYQQKLQSLGIPTDQAEMKRILELVKAGKLQQAIEMAERMTPADKPGAPDIHFWLAGIYFDEQGSLKGQPALDKAIYHLSQVELALKNLDISGPAFPPNVVMLKAMIAFRNKNVVDGLSLLKSVSDRFWPALVLQMETHIKLGSDEEAMRDAVALSQAVKREPTILDEVSTQFFPMWCAALEKAGEREELKRATMIWHQKHPEDPRGLGMWSFFQLQEIDALLARGSDEDLSRSTKMIISVSNKLGSKGHADLTTWFLGKLPPKGTNRNYLQLADLVEKDPDVSSTLLEILGTAATIRGEHKLALELLKRATEKDSSNFIAWNNLAFVANSYFDDDLELAINAVDQGVKLQPNDINILHTRGIIRVKLKQWDLAIEDLRKVVVQKPNEIDVHRGLAQAYNALGKSDLAAFHQQLAK